MNNTTIKIEFILEEYQNRIFELEKEILLLKAYVKQVTSEEQKEKVKEK